MGKITLSNVAEELAAKSGLSKEAADHFLHAVVDTIEKGLSNDKIVKIKGLGTFKLMDMSDRGSVDVSTGERITIKGYTKVSFTPDSSMKEFVNRPFAHFEPTELNDGYPDEEDEVMDSEESIEETSISSDVEPTNVVVEVEKEAREVETAKISEPEVIENVEPVEEVGAMEEISETPEPTEPTETAETIESIENIADMSSEVPVSSDTDAQEEEKTNLPDEEVEVSESVVAEKKEENTSEPNTKVVEGKSKKRFGCWGVGCLVVLLFVAVMAIIGVLYFTEYDTAKHEIAEQGDIRVNPNLEKELVVEQGDKSASNSTSSDKTTKPVVEVKQTETVVPVKTDVKTPSEEAKPIQPTTEEKPVTVSTTNAFVVTEALAARNIKDITVADTTDYSIEGTLATHVLKEGETIIQLSRKYYGDKRLWPYIVKHNHITDFNKVAVGMSMNIPVLTPKTNK